MTSADAIDASPLEMTAPQESGSVAVFERRSFERALSARVVKPHDWARLGELDALLDRVNALYGEVEAQLAQAREAAQAEGFAEGLRRAQQQMTAQLTALNERRARIDQCHRRVLSLGQPVGRHHTGIPTTHDDNLDSCVHGVSLSAVRPQFAKL